MQLDLPAIDVELFFSSASAISPAVTDPNN